MKKYADTIWFLVMLLLAASFTACEPGKTTPGIELEEGAASTPDVIAAAGKEAFWPGMDGTTPRPDGACFRMSMINVGKGDALLLSLPEGGFALVDVGMKADHEILMEALNRFGAEKLEAVFLTHGHKDHAGGLKKLLESGCPVQSIYTAALDTQTYSKKTTKLIAESGAEHRLLEAGQTLELEGVAIEVLAPLEVHPDEENDYSLVLRLEYGQRIFLLMGDATQRVERQLLALDTDLKADILKAGRHGKDDATCPAFLAAVSPKAVAFTGSTAEDQNSLNPMVLQRVQESGAQCYTNQGEHLLTSFVTDGNSLWVEIE